MNTTQTYKVMTYNVMLAGTSCGASYRCLIKTFATRKAAELTRKLQARLPQLLADFHAFITGLGFKY